MVKKDTWAELSEFLSGRYRSLDEISDSTRRYYMAIKEFSEPFKHDEIIPVNMQPQIELPMILAAHCYMASCTLDEAMDSIIPRLSVARIRVFTDNEDWDPSRESISQFVNRHGLSSVKREVLVKAQKSITQFWGALVQVARQEMNTCCPNYGNVAPNKINGHDKTLH